MSLNSSFRIHAHVDKKDFPNGLTALINVQKNEDPGQLHVLVDYALTKGGTPGIAIDLGNGSGMPPAGPFLLVCKNPPGELWFSSAMPVSTGQTMGSNEPVNDNNLSSSDRRRRCCILSSSEVIKLKLNKPLYLLRPKLFQSNFKWSTKMLT